MNFLQALEANKTKVVYRTGVYSHNKFKADELRNCKYLHLLDFEAEWEAEELPQVVEFEAWATCLTAYIKNDIYFEVSDDNRMILQGKRWKVRCEEIK